MENVSMRIHAKKRLSEAFSSPVARGREVNPISVQDSRNMKQNDFFNLYESMFFQKMKPLLLNKE